LGLPFVFQCLGGYLHQAFNVELGVFPRPLPNSHHLSFLQKTFNGFDGVHGLNPGAPGSRLTEVFQHVADFMETLGVFQGIGTQNAIADMIAQGIIKPLIDFQFAHGFGIQTDYFCGHGCFLDLLGNES
jgi:hypothetical protein